MDFSIKKLTAVDSALAKELILFYQEDDGVADPVIPSDEYLAEMLSKNDFHIIIALHNGNLAGGLTGYELPMYKKEVKEMFLYEIAVKPEYRQQGIGKALIERLKEICREKEIPEMYVGTSTPNIAAMNLYNSTGGEQEPDIAWFVFQCL